MRVKVSCLAIGAMVALALSQRSTIAAPAAETLRIDAAAARLPFPHYWETVMGRAAPPPPCAPISSAT